MAVDSSAQVQDYCSVLVLTDEDTRSVQCDPQLTLSTYLTVHGSQVRSDAPLNCQNMPDIVKQNASAYCPCAANNDIEKGCLDKGMIKDDISVNTKSEIAFTKALRRQNSLQPASEPERPFMNHILMLLKLDPKDKQGIERVHDAPNNKWRKYKRPAVFDSRQIVLLFSILSSLGTIVLIYLTLRVRQAGEGPALA